jgi:hypothetical protein
LNAALVGLAVWSVAPVHARTIHVELDGSGDTRSLETAELAASPGDTIQIGPGTWNEDYTWSTLDGQVVQALLGVNTDSLTIRGAGEGLTILGIDDGDRSRFGITIREDVSALVVEDLVIRGMSSGLANRGGAISIARVGMEHNFNGVLISTGSLSASECRFEDIQALAFAVVGGTEFVRVASSDFTRVTIGIQVNPAIYAEVVDCTFVDCGAGVYADGATIDVERVTMTNVQQALTVRRSIGVLNVTGAEVHGVDFAAVFCTSRGYANVVSSSFTDTVGPAIVLEIGAVMRMNDCDLIPRPGEDFIRVSSYPDEPVTVFDFENNYWGTTDRQEIADRIQDGNDPPPNPAVTINAVVDFEPFRLLPVSNEDQSFGGFKGRFRQDD